MTPPPADWPRISTSVYYRDPAAAIDWLCEAFGFELRLKVEGEAGEIVHSELEFGGGLIMVGGEGAWSGIPGRDFARSPRSLDGANTQSLMVYVDDVAAHLAQAQAHGAVIVKELAISDYGEEYWADQGYACEDLEGHTWYFAQRLRTKGA
jgi:uncharacterized glyoxalase superfamily protein PhnB